MQTNQRGVPAISAESVKLREVMRLAKPNEVLTTEGLAAAIGLPVDQMRKREHCIYTAIRVLEREGIVFHRIRKTGWKRVDSATNEITDAESGVTKKISRRVKRSLRRLCAVAFDKLPNDQKIRHSAVSAQLGAIALFASHDATDKIRTAAITIGNGQKPDTAKVLELFR